PLIERYRDQRSLASPIRSHVSPCSSRLVAPAGVGLCGPVAAKDIPSREQQVHDLAAILDTVGSQRAVLVGYVAGAASAMVFAALHPERVESLILMMPYARMQLDDDYPIGIPGEVLDGIVQQTIEGWGTAQGIELIAPSMAGDPLFRAWCAQIERLGASPGTAGALVNMWFHVDVRSILPTIRVPTLVFGRKDQPLMTAAMARYVADHIDGARYVE